MLTVPAPRTAPAHLCARALVDSSVPAAIAASHARCPRTTPNEHGPPTATATATVNANATTHNQLWARSVQDGPAGYPLGFFVCAAACALGLLHSVFIR